jgi:hypothetical protein
MVAMIRHFLGHKFIGRKSYNEDFYLVCIECGIYAFQYSSGDKIDLYYVVDYDVVMLNISCNEFMIKKLLE